MGWDAFTAGVAKRRRKLSAMAGAVLALTLLTTGLAPRSESQAAQGQKWLLGVPWAGIIHTNSGTCSVTVVSEFLAITAKHCGTVNPVLKLDISAASTPGHTYDVKEIVPNRDLDVEAIYLRDRTGLSVTPLGDTVARDWFYAWGYGSDWSGNVDYHLTRADFNLPQTCLLNPQENGDLCWQTDAKNSVCAGDSGGPITQNNAIVGMLTTVLSTTSSEQPLDCSTIVSSQALTVKQMQPWLNQMIADANPFP